ncbi:class I SAM-dependent methyltransferase [uncultured Methanobrevibacter sp.]|uniref:class I SAM-dependent methyltransferase n=1 Tax=uncultured Methanobrevibacter sp. TaxID=253161 RepID=UPI0025FEF344|nr:class I SAM-dependent methyltransferase [uncultured Methanobrevibacter sp.]
MFKTLEIINENRRLRKKLNEYERQYPPKECPVCGYKGIDFMPYPQIIHKEVKCPNCFSQERHRATWLYLEKNEHLLEKGNKILHFAPERPFYDLFKSKDIEYHAVDLYSTNPLVEEKMDIQDIHYDDDYFDFIYCSHILEHVPDDFKAMRELRRVLKPGGIALIMVPINGVVYELPFDESKTHEDENINTPEAREKYYGQDDHVRLYGSDFKERLLESGFNLLSDDFIKKLGFETIERYALLRNESLFECTK